MPSLGGGWEAAGNVIVPVYRGKHDDGRFRSNSQGCPEKTQCRRDDLHVAVGGEQHAWLDFCDGGECDAEELVQPLDCGLLVEQWEGVLALGRAGGSPRGPLGVAISAELGSD